MFKWLGKKIEKFTTIFHGEVVIEKEAALDSNNTSLDVMVNESVSGAVNSYYNAIIRNYKSGSTGDGEFSGVTLLGLTSIDSSTNHASSGVVRKGLVISLNKVTDFTGNPYLTGLEMVVSNTGSPSTTKGIVMQVENEGEDIRMVSSATSDDYCTIATTTNGATTIKTVDGVGDLAHFEIAAEGDITLDAAGDIKLECGGGNLTCDASDITISNAGSSRPSLSLFGQANSSSAPVILLANQRVSLGAIQPGQDGDYLGTIFFLGYNDGTPANKNYASIVGTIADATTGQEAGQLELKVAEYDGTLTSGLTLDGDTDANGEIDVTIGAGAASVTTVAGTLTMGSTASMTNAGLLVVKQPAAKVYQEQIVNLKGFCTLTTNYQFNEDSADTKAPFEVALDYGSATISSGTEVTQSSLFRGAGFHVPHACEITDLQIQSTCKGGSGDSENDVYTIALVEYRPSNLAADTNDYPRTVYCEESIASLDHNNKIVTTNVDTTAFSENTIAAGSHLQIFVKGDTDSVSVGAAVQFSVSIKLEW